jgi:hypothetical protein
MLYLLGLMYNSLDGFSEGTAGYSETNAVILSMIVLLDARMRPDSDNWTL